MSLQEISIISFSVQNDLSHYSSKIELYGMYMDSLELKYADNFKYFDFTISFDQKTCFEN